MQPSERAEIQTAQADTVALWRGLRPRRAAALQAGLHVAGGANTQFPVIQVLLTVKLNCLSSVSTACSRGTPSIKLKTYKTALVH